MTGKPEIEKRYDAPVRAARLMCVSTSARIPT